MNNHSPSPENRPCHGHAARPLSRLWSFLRRSPATLAGYCRSSDAALRLVDQPRQPASKDRHPRPTFDPKDLYLA